MTRKKFVKKLMGVGISRNKANEFAKLVDIFDSYRNVLCCIVCPEKLVITAFGECYVECDRR